jgi:hypothetical protein
MKAIDHARQHLANMPAERRAQLEAEWLHPDAVRVKRMRERAAYEHQKELERG